MRRDVGHALGEAVDQIEVGRYLNSRSGALT